MTVQEKQEPYNETELLSQVAQHNEKAFSTLVDRYSRKVFVHLLTFVKSYEVAEELAQDIFVKIWNNRSALNDIKNFQDYLFIISRNHLISYLRKKLPPAVAFEPNELQDFFDSSIQVEYKELQKRLNDAIHHLKPRQQEIFKLSREEGLTYQQIAQQLNISSETVKWHLAEALNSIRVYVRERGDLLVIGWLLFITAQ